MRVMKSNSRIYIAGHTGLVGSAICRNLAAQGCSNLITRTHEDLDLTIEGDVTRFFARERPEFVFLAAAKVGGIVANDSYPASFLMENLAIEFNVIQAAQRFEVERLLFLGSSCIYPRLAPQPIREEYLMSGPLEKTNRAYALAKIAGIEMCAALNRQRGSRFLAVMPTNIYGRADTYHAQHSHVIPGMILKMHEAKVTGKKKVELWGTGTPRREFLYSDDLAAACVMLMNLDAGAFDSLLSHPAGPLINIGCGEDVTIAELAQLVAGVTGFSGTIRFDTSRPDGTPRKLLDISRIEALGWRPRVALDEGLKEAYADFASHKVLRAHA